MEILSVSSLHKSFDSHKAVHNISFSVERGDIFAFLGPNGAGKTTTLRMLLGIISADQGDIQWNFNGKKSALPQPEQIGYLPEERGLYPDLPVIRSLVYLATIRGMNPALARETALEWLEKLGLASRAHDKLQTLSKGNQQKIQFVSAILHRPSFVIFDEPFSGLDPLNQEKFMEYIRELNDQGTTILLSAHQMALVEKLAGKILLINQGKEIFNGTLAEAFHHHGGQQILDLTFNWEIPAEPVRTFEGVETLEILPDQVWRIYFEHGTSLTQVIRRLAELEGIVNIKSKQADLHDIFVNLVKQYQQ